MTRRKDPEPEADLPQETPPAEPIAGDPVAVTDPVIPLDPPPETEPEPSPPVTAPVVIRRSSFLAPLVGGALAAVGGFALAHFDVIGLRPTDASAELTTLGTQLGELQTRMTSLETLAGDVAAISDRVAQLEAAPAPPVPDLTRLDTLDDRLAAIEAIPPDGDASAAAVTAKLADLERRLATLPQGDSPELQQELNAALARLDDAEAAATARAEEAAGATAAAERIRALDALADKLSAGQPFGPELKVLEDPALHQALAPLAETGVPTLAQLQETYPDAAREALRIARETSASDGWGDRFLDFFAAQTEARPLTPLPGDTPEAILSRADLALAEGRVADAVAELDLLDPAIKPAVDPWLEKARAHISAAAAVQTARGE